MSYFAILQTEDGLHIEKIKDVEAWLKEQHDPDVSPEHHTVFLGGLEFWDDCLQAEHYPAAVLIKGEIVVPKPIKVVTEYMVD